MKVKVAAHLCLDITPKFVGGEKPDLGAVFSPGKLTTVEEAVLSVGGPVANTGLAMAKLGADVVLNGKVGEDTFGEVIRKQVGEKRAAAFKVVSDQNTSYTIVFALPGIDRFVLHDPGRFGAGSRIPAPSRQAPEQTGPGRHWLRRNR